METNHDESNLNQEDLNAINIDSGFTKFCGVVKLCNYKQALSYFQKCDSFEEILITDKTRQEKQTLFFDGFINTFHPNVARKSQEIYKKIHAFRDTRYSSKTIELGENIDINVTSIEYYIYPDDLLIYVLTLSNVGLSLSELQKRNFMIKMVNWYGTDKCKYHDDYLKLFDDIFKINTPQATATESIELKPDTREKFHRLFMGNMFYIYQVVKLPQKGDSVFHDYGDRLLYELTTILDDDTIGMMTNPNHSFYPASQYYENFMKKSMLKVYNDWSALVTIDTFCVLMKSSLRAFNYEQWEDERFKLFLNSVLLKNYLVKCNEKFQTEPVTTTTKDGFLKFERIFNLRTVSYNSLPQLIYEKIRRSFEIEEELALVNQKISQFSDNRNQQKDRILNYVLAFIALLSVISFLNDGYQWLEAVGKINFIQEYITLTGKELPVSIFLLILVIALFFTILGVRKFFDKSNK